MKRIITMIICAGLLFSCKKENEQMEQPKAPTEMSKSTFTPSIVLPPVTADTIGQFIQKVHNVEGLMVAPDILFTGTVPLSGVKNFFFTYHRKSDGVLLFRSATKASLTQTYIHQGWVQLPKNTECVLTLYADIQSGVMGTMTAKLNIEYTWTDAPQTQWIPEQTGQTKVYGFASAPTVTSLPSTTQITNGVFCEINKITVQASSQGPSAIKGITWRNSFVNNSNAGTMRFDSLRLFINNTDVTGQWVFIDSLGTTVSSISQASVGSKKLHAVPITGVAGGMAEVQTGETIDFFLWGVPRGFGGDSVISDVFSCLPLKDVSPAPSGWVYLNRGTVGLHPKLYSSPYANSAAKTCHFTWSPMTFAPFSAAYGAQCPDWYNSFGIVFNVSPVILQSRRQ